MLSWLLSKPDIAFEGLGHRSYPSEQPRCPAKKIFFVFLKNKCTFEMGLYIWH